jgi:hypothetical protein
MVVSYREQPRHDFLTLGRRGEKDKLSASFPDLMDVLISKMLLLHLMSVPIASLHPRRKWRSLILLLVKLLLLVLSGLLMLRGETLHVRDAVVLSLSKLHDTR